MVVTIVVGLVGPLLGFLGVAFGLLYRRKHDRKIGDDREAEFYQTKRREAYVDLWNVVQDAHLSMRTSLDRSLKSDFSVFLTNVNSFAWKHGLYVDEDDRRLAQQYLFAVYEFLRLVSQNEATRRWVETSMAIMTPSGPTDIPSRIAIMKVAEEAADAVSDKLAARIRTVLGAPPLPSSEPPTSDGKMQSDRFMALLKEQHDTSPWARRGFRELTGEPGSLEGTRSEETGHSEGQDVSQVELPHSDLWGL